MAVSRVVSWVPSWPRGLKAYCRSDNPPASLISNSASLRFAAPKSTARNDFEFSIQLYFRRTHSLSTGSLEAQHLNWKSSGTVNQKIARRGSHRLIRVDTHTLSRLPATSN